MSRIDPYTAATEAARVAYVVAAHDEHSQSITLRARDFIDVSAAVKAALSVRTYPGPHTLVTTEATYDCHGVNADIGPGTFRDKNGITAAITTVVSTVRSSFSITNPTLIPVIGDIDRQIYAAEHEANAAAMTSVPQIIHIIDDQQED